MFAKAGWYQALPKPPDWEIDLSLGWKAVDRKADAARKVPEFPDEQRHQLMLVFFFAEQVGVAEPLSRGSRINRSRFDEPN